MRIRSISSKCEANQIKFYCKTCNKKICEACFFDRKHGTHAEWTKVKTLEDNYFNNIKDTLKSDNFNRRYFKDDIKVDPFSIIKNQTITQVNSIRSIISKLQTLVDEIFANEKRMIEEIEVITKVDYLDQDPISRIDKFLENG